MDFLDPHKRRKQRLHLLIGYGLIACAISLATLILVYEAYGYGINKSGQIIQNGFVFVNSTPSPAQIYLNGTLSPNTTNTRLQLPAGQYTMKLVRAGYRPWVRSVGVDGGSVEHFAYPFLFPTTLQTATVQTYDSTPGTILQSPDRHWLLIEDPDNPNNFTEYDLSNHATLASTVLTDTVPTSILTNSTGPSTYQLVQWSTDDRHVLLLHNYGSGSEYIIFDRQTPADSVNLTKTLGLNSTTSLLLDNDKYDQYFELDSANHSLQTATISSPTPVPFLQGVISYKSYGSNTVLYTAAGTAPDGSVDVELFQNNHSYVVRQIVASSSYLLDLTQYSGNWYVVVGDATANKVYVYENPVNILSASTPQPLIPAYILKVNQPNFEAFSANAQFIMAEGSNGFAVYDIQNQNGYAYDVNVPLAAGQHATWMDGDRLVLTANNHMIVFDYDDANQQSLQPAINGSLVYFDQNYKWVYNEAVNPTTNQYNLSDTALLIPADQ